MNAELKWLLLLVFGSVILVNATGLGHQTPTTIPAVVIRDGLILKAGPDIFLIESGHKRHIINLDAFTGKGFAWERVQQVDQSVINALPDGPPVAVLLKGSGPEIYLLDKGHKRHILTIKDFEQTRFVWDDVRFVSDTDLRRLPDGPPVPPLTPVPTSSQ
ncbi:MAG: hypothetical protein M5U01_26740 [Ardenticatenaceae bacterium]|nr:hypothetical protein [Ardenticatenaceae bacterium]